MRLFFAVKLPEALKSALGDFIMPFRGLPARVKWVEPRNMHLTLKFLGETDREQLDELKAAATEAAGGASPFELNIYGSGAFPNLRRPRVFWVGIDDPQKGLQNLQKTLDYNLGQIGFETESKKFSPHLTLGRVKERGEIGQLGEAFSRAVFPPVKVAVSEFFLIESKLRPTGPVYTDLIRFPL